MNGRFAAFPSMEPTPSDPDWCESKIRTRAMTWRSQYLPYSGKLVVSGGLVLLAAVLTGVFAPHLSWRHVPAIAVGIGLVGLLGWNFRDALWTLDDPYHTQYYDATLAVIEAETSEHETVLKHVANQHLEQVTDEANRSAADDALQTCAKQLASTYEAQTTEPS